MTCPSKKELVPIPQTPSDAGSSSAHQRDSTRHPAITRTLLYLAVISLLSFAWPGRCSSLSFFCVPKGLRSLSPSAHLPYVAHGLAGDTKVVCQSRAQARSLSFLRAFRQEYRDGTRFSQIRSRSMQRRRDMMARRR